MKYRVGEDFVETAPWCEAASPAAAVERWASHHDDTHDTVDSSNAAQLVSVIDENGVRTEWTLHRFVSVTYRVEALAPEGAS